MDRFRGIEDYGMSQVSYDGGALSENQLNVSLGTKSADVNAKGVGYWEAMGNTGIRRICGLKSRSWR